MMAASPSSSADPTASASGSHWHWSSSNSGQCASFPSTQVLNDAIVPYHSRQVALLGAEEWKPWLDGEPARELLRPAAAGTLEVREA